MEQSPNEQQLTEVEMKEAKQRRDELKRELQARGELPKDTSDEELEKSKRSWQNI